MDSIISTFHIDWKIIIAQAVNFGVVFTVLYIFALKPLNKLMQERSEKISKGVEDAKQNEELLKACRADYDEVIKKAKNEAYVFSEKAKKEREIEKSASIENTKKEVEAIIQNGKKMMENEKVKMVEDAKKEIVSLTMLATEKLISSKKDLNDLP